MDGVRVVAEVVIGKLQAVPVCCEWQHHAGEIGIVGGLPGVHLRLRAGLTAPSLTRWLIGVVM